MTSIDVGAMLEPMFKAVGEGLLAFSAVEMGVNLCFATMIQSPDRRRAVTAINSLRDFSGKLKMVDAVATFSLAEGQLRRWRGLSNRIQKRKEFRDKLAHWTVSLWPGAATAEEAANMKAALLPPAWSQHYVAVVWDPHTNREAKPIFLSQIEEFKKKAGALGSDLMEFSTEIVPIMSASSAGPISGAVKIKD